MHCIGKYLKYIAIVFSKVNGYIVDLYRFLKGCVCMCVCMRVCACTRARVFVYLCMYVYELRLDLGE